MIMDPERERKKNLEEMRKKRKMERRERISRFNKKIEDYMVYGLNLM